MVLLHQKGAGRDGGIVGRKVRTQNGIPGGALMAALHSLELGTPGSHTESQRALVRLAQDQMRILRRASDLPM